ncbi:MAG: carboxypeptidase regulatory-like domain-containing protein [Fibrobacter sp.]|nr:carboxypeptidase regulatory-like domain-containing protein [Fibrobacter sp.]
MRLATSLAALLSAFGFWACSNNDSVAGTATQTENTVASLDTLKGVVYHKNGTKTKGAVVRMVLSSKWEDAGWSDFRETETDAQGRFSFANVPADTFQLAVIDSASSEILYLPEASAEDDSLVLEAAAKVNGFLTLGDSALAPVSVGSHFKVYVSGIPFFESVFAPGAFELLVPEGSWTFGFCPGDPMVIEKLQESGIADSVIFRSWKMSKALKSGESLALDTLVWGANKKGNSAENNDPKGDVDQKDTTAKTDTTEAPAVPKAWISGQVDCSNLDRCDSVEVMVITDLFGFGFANGLTLEYDIQARTDTLGRWWLPAPEEVPYDSFRVEYRQRSGETVTNVGLSRYVKKSELEGAKDTLSIGKASLDKYSWISVGVRLVVDQQDNQQSENCFMNSVVLGIEGTSHFVRTVTCNMYVLTYLPSGMQKLIFYSGDPVVVSALQEAGTPQYSYVSTVDQNLMAGNGIKELWLTYTPPTVK